jgi:hypothetical protein
MRLRFKTVFCFALLGLTCLMLPNTSKADSFEWTYQGTIPDLPNGIINFGSGELTTMDGVINELSGTLNGVAIAGLLPPGAFAGNDNLLLLPASPLYVTLGGFSFADSTGMQFNIYASIGTECSCGPSGCVCAPYNLYGLVNGNGLDSDLGNFTLTSNIATPEPTAMAMLQPAVLGFALFAAWKRFRDMVKLNSSRLGPTA